MSGLERLRSRERVDIGGVNLPPFRYLAAPETESPKMGLTGIYKAEGGDPHIDYCAVGRLQNGQEVCLPERFLRAALAEAVMSGAAKVYQHPKVGGNPEQKAVRLSLSRIEEVLRFLNLKAPASRPFGPRPSYDLG